MTAPTIESTNGIWLIAVFLEAILQGMGLLQCFLYFIWYPRDPWIVKGTVIAMLVVECIQMGAAFSNVYAWLITGFGDFDNLDIIHREDMLQLTALYLSTFIAQAHFARCIYQLHKRNIVLPVIVFLLAVIALGGGIGQVILATGVKRYSELGKTSVTTNLQAAFALAADMLISFGLCWRLSQNRGGIQSTNKILNFLIMTAINRGVFTVLLAGLNIVLFVSQPGTFYFMLALLISDKVYMNSMLAMLNTRQYAVQLPGTTLVEHISMSAFSAKNRTIQTGISVSTVQETQHDPVDRSLDKGGHFQAV
ncbi:hypothetical protein MVEN_01736900 [Mycena venus]|uniref:DUF6534 domain-containing protein n=1 Tax=Mycena venus TaxID=2733690 RepID=A0A8H6XK38_9AGAR|nr:hypothetical protein MVEN_01736900 [Mycena venus]